jgi:hypothetical protein
MRLIGAVVYGPLFFFVYIEGSFCILTFNGQFMLWWCATRKRGPEFHYCVPNSGG